METALRRGAVVDDRFERDANWGLLDEVRRLAEGWQRFVGPGAGWLPNAFSWATARLAPMDASLFGHVTGLRDARRWAIKVNDALPMAAASATLGHEFGHTFQRVGLGMAFCAPGAGLPFIEQEAHALGAILTVPVGSVTDLRLDDHAAQRARASEISLPASYVAIRRSLAVFLEELPGDRRDASAYLNAGMLAHASWQVRIAAFMRESATVP